MSYIENPKIKGSGVFCAIPQTGECPQKCADCFFQGGRSYLEPLQENVPNIPDDIEYWHIIRVNDGHDSYFLEPDAKWRYGADATRDFLQKRCRGRIQLFFNTSIAKNFERYRGMPFVLTVNPAEMTDVDFHRVADPPINLMFVRIRVNTWNVESVVNPAISFYAERQVPVVLTFMRYYEETIPEGHRSFYIYKKKVLNDYWVLRTETWESIMWRHRFNKWVSSCGIEGEEGFFECRHCGVCLREYFATMDRMWREEK